MRKIFDFHGGVHPLENKQQTNQSGIQKPGLAKEYVLALNQHIGAPALPIVQVGEKVLKGQLLAEAQGFVSANIHAPTSGTISAIEMRSSNHPSGMAVQTIILQPDGFDKWTELESCEKPFELEPEQIIERTRKAGVTGMGGAGFPASVKLAANNISTFIVNAAECEPYITADDVLLREKSEEVVAGIALLTKLFSSLREVLIGIEDNKPEAIHALNQAIAEQHNASVNIEVLVIPTKYPSGGEKQLIKLLTGKEVPSGSIPASIGLVMQNVGTCRAAWRAVRYGEPLVQRVTTLSGEALKNQGNFELLIGTPVDHILKECGYKAENSERVIIGGPMMGWAIEDTSAPILKATNCVLAPSMEELPEAPPEQACIRCGLCAEACPAELLPQQLYWYSRAQDQEKLKAYNLFDCIECGACSYVCPSAIPLVQYYRAGKGEIRQAEKDKQKSDKARERFEARQQRIEKVEAEKEARRQQRKKAAAESKRKLSEKTGVDKKSTGEPDMKAIKSELVKDAMAAVKKTDASDPDKALARLKRGLSSAESRLQRAEASLQKNTDEGAEQSRLDALAARVKEAEQKVKEAQQKLEELNQ